MYITTIIGIVIICILVGFAVYNDNKWHEWANVHCKKIGEVSGSIGIVPTTTSDGNFSVGTIFIPGKTGYKCDDGMEYWR